MYKLKVSRKTRRVVLGVFLAFTLWFTWSFGSYVARDNGDTAAQRAVTWFRNHGLGKVVETAERVKYRKPPSSDPAQNLALTVSVTTIAVPAPAPDQAPSTTAATPDPTAPPTTIPPATTTTTIPAFQLPPQPFTPVVSPALDGEGAWSPIGQAGGFNSVWATSVRPLADAPAVVGSFAIIEQSHMRAAMFNGSDIPGGTGWQKTNRVPAQLQPAMKAAFNGGFRFEHIKGGYKNEGRVVRELKAGEGTLAISRDGKLTIGEYGRDINDDGAWVSFRQNLPLLVDAGVSQVERQAKAGVWWGADYGNVIYVFRSSVCQLADGRIMYGAVGKVDAELLARSLVAMGCVRGVQMDINGTWPTFFTFPADADGAQHGELLDRRMGGGRDRYLTGSTREFFAFFDVAGLPTASVVHPAPGV